MLEAYSVSGVIALSRRDGNRRVYDLTERLFPAELLAQEVPVREQYRHKLLSRFRAHGLLGKTGSGELWIGTGKAKPDPDRPGHPGRIALRDELVEAGDLVPVDVEGVPGERFVLREEVELLESPPEPATSVAFLAPLDPLMWDRALLQPLYGFDSIWEVYVPEAKRRWDYYVLPILFRDRLVGRIEPRIDRAGRGYRCSASGGGRLRPAEGGRVRRRDARSSCVRISVRRGDATHEAPQLAKRKRLFLRGRDPRGGQ